MGYAKKLKTYLPDTNHGILKTGDAAYFDKKGFFYIVGRKIVIVKFMELELTSNRTWKNSFRTRY